MRNSNMSKKEEKSPSSIKVFNTTDLARLESIVNQEPVFKKTNLNEIVVSAQMRKSFLGIPDLADNIYLLGLLNPIIINYKSKENILDLRAGERRFRAHKYLIDNANTYVSEIMKRIPEEQFKDEKQYNGLFTDLKKAHIKRFSKINSFIFTDLTEEQRRAIQYAENSYMPVNPAEAAEAYVEGYEWLKQDYIQRGRPELTVTQFARIVGKNPSTIKKALRFMTLEPEIREWAKKKILKYGAAVILSQVPDPEYRKLFAAASIASQQKITHDSDYKGEIAQVQEKVRKYLEEVVSGQANLFGDAKTLYLERKRNIVDKIGRDLHTSAVASAHYTKHLIDIYPVLLKKEGMNVFSYKSVRQRIKLMNELYEKMMEIISTIPNDVDDKLSFPKITIEYF